MHHIRIDTRIELGRSQQEVFDYVTNATLCHTWHAATVEVCDAPERPLTAGETALEYIKAYDRRDQVLWMVASCVAPEHWGIATVVRTGTAPLRIGSRQTDWDVISTVRYGFAPNAGHGGFLTQHLSRTLFCSDTQPNHAFVKLGIGIGLSSK